MRQKKIKNAGKENLIEKVKRKLRLSWVSKMRNTKLYPYCYRSYWHAIFGRNSKENVTKGAYSNLYFAARPNPGAGIGHQMANWIAGFWFSEQFGLKFAHIPFSNVEWEDFLGFYQDEKTMKELKNEGYLIKRIPKFDEANSDEVATIKRIIDSYKGKQVVFLAEQDQFYQEQFGVMEQIQEKFYKAPARKNDKLMYDSSCFNIAIHVRRGDIVQKQGEDNPNLTMRYQSNDYFVNALKTVLEYLKEQKNVHIYLFSQGKEEDFQDFEAFKNLHLCLDMGAQDSFLHMIYADALITSKSSFSYKPALLNKGLKFCPANFWHGYPHEKDWILLDETGKIK